MALTWESFSEALGQTGGLFHLVKEGEKDALCGASVQAGNVEGKRPCPKCKQLRREAIGEES